MPERYIGGDPYSDPEAGNVTDGSVDYYDFDWGDPVYYPESEMEPHVYNCDAVCNAGCCGSSNCSSNTPDQDDDPGYVIIDV